MPNARYVLFARYPGIEHEFILGFDDSHVGIVSKLTAITMEGVVPCECSFVVRDNISGIEEVLA